MSICGVSVCPVGHRDEEEEKKIIIFFSQNATLVEEFRLFSFFEDSKDKENGPRALEKFCASVTQNGVK